MEKFIKLQSLEFHESRGDQPHIDVEKFNLHDFNLVIGDNAQGKSRFLRTLNFVSDCASGAQRKIETNFNAIFSFKYFSDNKERNLIYKLSIRPDGDKNIFEEDITLSAKYLFSTKKNKLFDEIKNKPINTFYIPDNISAISSLKGKEFITINLIRSFFQRLTYISSSKAQKVGLFPDTVIPNAEGSNLSNVLYNWSIKHPNRYNEVINELKSNFKFIKKIYFTKDKKFLEGMNPQLITFKEQGVFEEIKQGQWSDGLYRTLHLLTSVKIPYRSNSHTEYPSLILIDEIENGLDYNTLNSIVNYLLDYSDQSQIIVTSHSPLVSEMIHPKYWLIVKRFGTTVKLMSPSLKEQDLEKTLELFKREHWSFYSKHIANSSLYSESE